MLHTSCMQHPRSAVHDDMQAVKRHTAPPTVLCGTAQHKHLLPARKACFICCLLDQGLHNKDHPWYLLNHTTLVVGHSISCHHQSQSYSWIQD